MALPFEVVAATNRDLAAQTFGALASNPLWGRLGDSAGKLRLLQVVTAVRTASPLLVLALIVGGARVVGFAALFFLIGAMMNGVTIGYLGFLMEISPDDRRPAYSAWVSAFAAPAALAPLFGAGLVSLISIEAVFATAILAALLQVALLSRLSKLQRKRPAS